MKKPVVGEKIPLGLYIHIPFCRSKCRYCDFYSLQNCDHLMPEYQEALLDHIEESSRSIKKYEVDSIYFGGGTPSLYGADKIVVYKIRGPEYHGVR